jgi:hypothetical protein
MKPLWLAFKIKPVFTANPVNMVSKMITQFEI